MRSPHNPQPSVNLGDDPDPAAELGPRLAGASQTAQGLLTNYLFYGQRRSAQRDQVQAETGTNARALDRLHQQNGGSISERTAQALQSQRTLASRGEGTQREGGRSVQSLVAIGNRTLGLVERQQEREQATAVPAGFAGPGRDALAVDSLAEDPLGRDLLSSPEDPATQTAHQPPPVLRN